jgi:acyl-CoA synthetase (AMP-forming)/AMP-acid ligase II
MTGLVPDIAFRATLPELLHRAAERYGDNDYVVLPHRRISFAEAERLSRELARRFVAAGVAKGTRVGIILPTGIEWVIAWLAAARIGAMPMLFPATYRPAELQRTLRISDADLLLAPAQLLGKDYEIFLEQAVPGLAEHKAGPLRLIPLPFLRSIWMIGGQRAWAHHIDLDSPGPEEFSDELLAAIESEVSPSDPLLVIYTSGSSADPKAVVHTHGATVRKVQAELGMCLPGSLPGRTFAAMPFFWVGGPQNLLGALHSGAAVVTQERFDAEEAVELLARERCTSILGWPTVLDTMRKHPRFASGELISLPGRADIPLSSRGDPPNVGMTETFGPHANRKYFDYKIVDPDTGRELLDGEEGEFCVRGFALMASLYKREREEVFDADGYYHTGDRCYVENGNVWFKGRYTETVKVGGANVAPLEVEKLLESYPEVAMAFVIGIDDQRAGEIVAAVVVPDDGATIDTDALRIRTNAQLSAYKVPTRWLVLTEPDVPRLGSGKPDKRTMRTLFAPV